MLKNDTIMNSINPVIKAGQREPVSICGKSKPSVLIYILRIQVTKPKESRSTNILSPKVRVW